ncbi:ABC transporter ATP-binding protein [Cellulomonas triticagri]|uniref:ABC transporter ATP-binding protein n=1 Tax=Cellulomonas triticagri TaxID=2483352 RepID=A0A3M2JEN3_9CELL|nr:ABC transporter ATP-binding protein [Cellulomonas triticagri]RMI09425.1 ABC transporter ATP-binding protein [Cellulomonas triticagri]
MTTLALDGLGKRFGAATAVADLTLDVPSGAFLVLLGPSGCGKTTTLRMLAGLEEPTSGRIRLGDRVVADPAAGVLVPAQRRGTGMVFQSYALWPHMSVRQNVAWPLAVARWSRADRTARVTEVLAALDIADLADRSPAQISGGQQQRVAIARTIAPRPEVVLFDEPLSNLDARLRVETRDLLGRVHRSTGATSVYVTHDQVEALALATHVAVLRDGRLEQVGTPTELLERPATAFVAGFLGNPPAVLLAGETRDGVLRRGDLRLADVPGGATARHAMYRPQDLRLDPEGEVDLDVVESTPAAGDHLVTGLVPAVAAGRAGSGETDAGPQRITVVADRRVEPGTRTRLRLPAVPAALFGPDGARL